MYKERVTKETSIKLELFSENTNIKTDYKFFNHLLTLLSFHSGINITVDSTDDNINDYHHLIEDIGIILGDMFRDHYMSFNNSRYGSFLLPMDDSLVRTVLDLSNRAYFFVNYDFKTWTNEEESIFEFLRCFTINARINLHIDIIRGVNTHHILEAIFKSLGRSLRIALVDSDTLQSTKGVL